MGFLPFFFSIAIKQSQHMSKDPAFLFYSSDFISGVADLTMEERGQYITLLCLQHQKGELTPKTIKISTPNLSDDVLKKFRKLDNGNYANDKLCETISERTAHAKHQKFKAYLTNSIIKLKKEFPKLNPNKFKDFVHKDKVDYSDFDNDKFKEYFQSIYKKFANAQRTPLEDEDENEDKDVIKSKIINVPFEDFWNLYDKKVGDKTKIEKKWEKLTNQERIEIMDYIPRYKLSQPEKKYRKNPDTFFNNKSWNDEIITSEIKQQNTQTKTNDNGQFNQNTIDLANW